MAETATTEKPRDIGPDGEKIADMAYYDLLEVRGDASELEIKKAYRKMAIRVSSSKSWTMVGWGGRLGLAQAQVDHSFLFSGLATVSPRQAARRRGKVQGGHRFIRVEGGLVQLLNDPFAAPTYR